MQKDRIVTHVKKHVPPRTTKLVVFYLTGPGPDADREPINEIPIEGRDSEDIGEDLYEITQSDCDERRSQSRYLLVGFDADDKATHQKVLRQTPDISARGDWEHVEEEPSARGLLQQHMRFTESMVGSVTRQSVDAIKIANEMMKTMHTQLRSSQKQNERLSDMLDQLSDVVSDGEFDEKRRTEERKDKFYEVLLTNVAPELLKKFNLTEAAGQLEAVIKQFNPAQLSQIAANGAPAVETVPAGGQEPAK